MPNPEVIVPGSKYDLKNGALFVGLVNLVFSIWETYQVIIASGPVITENSLYLWIIAVLFGVAWVLMSTILVTGIIKNLSRYVQSWNCFQILMMVVNIIGCFLGSSLLIINKRIGEGVSLILFSLIVFGIAVYALFVVWDMRKKIAAERQQSDNDQPNDQSMNCICCIV